MSNLGPISVVKSGANIQNPTPQETILNSTQPFTKLDTQNIVSFQTISILFNSEPPQPPITAPFTTDTIIYQFEHGYTYVPSVWVQWQNQSPAFPDSPGTGASATTFYPFGDDTIGPKLLGLTQQGETNDVSTLAFVTFGFGTGAAIATGADLYVTIDDTNVYIHIVKTTIEFVTGGSSSIPLFLAGTTLNLRCYVFTEPASTSTY